MFHVSGSRDLMFDEAKAGLEQALARAKACDRLARRVEVWGDVLAHIDTWRPGARNPEAHVVRDDARQAALADIDAMPDGVWITDAIEAVAKHAGVAGRQRLLARALRNQGEEVAGAKAVLKAAGDDRTGLEQLLEAAPPVVRAAVLDADDALDAAWGIDDPAKKAEALRVLIWKCDDPERLTVIAQSANRHLPEDQARVWTQVGARLDKLGHDGTALWAAAEARLADVPEARRAKLQRKLDEAQERAGAKPAAPAPKTQPAAPAVEGPPRSGHTLALVNTYEGGLKMPHLRAAARAAPLCHAFGLDLALVDFPVADLGDLVAAVESETGIGEGGRYLAGLHAAGRLLDRAPKTWVATTPKPDAGKVRPLAGLGPTCFLMGVGPKGLPQSILEGAEVHYEITGTGVSLETATAMGILAERLRALTP